MTNKYGISKELADKIDKEYDELLRTDPAKLGFKEEKEMSVKELVITNIYDSGSLKIKEEGDKFKIDADCLGLRVGLNINRANAHLLYLYLKERFEPK